MTKSKNRAYKGKREKVRKMMEMKNVRYVAYIKVEDKEEKRQHSLLMVLPKSSVVDRTLDDKTVIAMSVEAEDSFKNRFAISDEEFEGNRIFGSVDIMAVYGVTSETSDSDLLDCVTELLVSDKDVETLTQGDDIHLSNIAKYPVSSELPTMLSQLSNPSEEDKDKIVFSKNGKKIALDAEEVIIKKDGRIIADGKGITLDE